MPSRKRVNTVKAWGVVWDEDLMFEDRSIGFSPLIYETREAARQRQGTAEKVVRVTITFEV